MSDQTWLAEIRARHSVSAPFIGHLDRASRNYNLAREDRAVLIREYDQVRTALAGLVEALAVNDEDGLTEFAPQMQAARAALNG